MLQHRRRPTFFNPFTLLGLDLDLCNNNNNNIHTSYSTYDPFGKRRQRTYFGITVNNPVVVR